MTKKQVTMVTFAMVLANVMAGLDSTIINTAIPAIIADLHGIQFMGVDYCNYASGHVRFNTNLDQSRRKNWQ